MKLALLMPRSLGSKRSTAIAEPQILNSTEKTVKAALTDDWDLHCVIKAAAGKQPIESRLHPALTTVIPTLIHGCLVLWGAQAGVATCPLFPSYSLDARDKIRWR